MSSHVHLQDQKLSEKQNISKRLSKAERFETKTVIYVSETAKTDKYKDVLYDLSFRRQVNNQKRKLNFKNDETSSEVARK